MPTTYAEFVSLILEIINLMIVALFAVVFVYFIWKMIDSWIFNAGEDTKREEGKKYAVAAVIAFVVMVSAWGIVIMLKNSIF
jgi:succinate dehydrogenase hydrophobic anchor subunit